MVQMCCSVVQGRVWTGVRISEEIQNKHRHRQGGEGNYGEVFSGFRARRSW